MSGAPTREERVFRGHRIPPHSCWSPGGVAPSRAGAHLRCSPALRLAQGPYVLVLVARGALGTGAEDERRSRLPAMWLIKAYTRLTRPYKKNVKYDLDITSCYVHS